MPDVEAAGRTVSISNPNKVLFPDENLTKGDLIEYYERIADVMLPHVRDRCVTLRRYPDGVDTDGFIQQEIPDHFPDWIDRKTVDKKGGTVTHALCNDAASLVYLAQQACITPHTWLSRTDKLRHPDRMIFDLDPSREDFDALRTAARRIRDVLQEAALTPFVMTSGSKGLHVVVPLARADDFDEVRRVARGLADSLAEAHPDTLTTEQRKKKRNGRIFLDTLRNSYAQTSAPPYSVRARTAAPVATPVTWDELGDAGLHPQRYTIKNLFRRLGQTDDPWADIESEAGTLDTAREMLDEQKGS